MPSWLKITLILLLGAAIRIPGIFWGEIDRTDTAIVLEPDEFQHADIAGYYLRKWDPDMGYDPGYRIWNAQAFGYQMAWIAYVGEKMDWVKSKNTKLVLIGRFLSVLYGLALVFLVYHFALLLFNREKIALLAALLMAVFDLDITYSHYALPEESYIFWTHAAIFFIGMLYIRLARTEGTISWRELLRAWPLWLATNFCLALSLGTKLDFIPFLISGLAFAYLTYRRQLQLLKLPLLAILMLLTTSFFFFVAHGFHLSFADLKYSYDIASGLNKDVVAKGNHLLYNPIVYTLGFIGGAGLPAFLLAIAGSIKALRKRGAFLFSGRHQQTALAFWLIFLALEFLTRWLIDTSFIRRANFVLPYIAVFAALAWYHLIAEQPGRRKNLWLGMLVAYTLGIAIVSQYNFWQDTRYRAISYLQEGGYGNDIQYSGYAWVPGMPGAANRQPENPKLLVIHEAFYGRVWKSFTTPFKVPECCDEVYHCPPEETCRYYQSLLRNESDFELVKIFPTIEVFPERLLFKHLLGSYETFLGDLRIYRKREGQ